MHSHVLSDNEDVASKVQEILFHTGHDCSMSKLAAGIPQSNGVAKPSPDMVMIVLPADGEQGRALVRGTRETFRGRLLAIGPTNDPKPILQILREGADHYLDEADLETELEAVLARQRASGSAPTETGQILAVLGTSGGCGCSTLAANLAVCLTQEKDHCVLFDLKPGWGDLASLLDLKPAHTLTDLCANVAAMDRVMFERSLIRHDSGVRLLAPPLTISDIARVTPQGIRQALTLARSLSSYVILDVDDCFHEEQMEALRLSDVILLVFRLDFNCLRNTQRSLDQLDHLGVHRERVRLIVNRYGQAKELAWSKAEEILGVKIFHFVPEDSKTVNRANNAGVAAVLDSPRAAVSKSIAKLALTLKEINKSR
jgi:pilus assembly protein CpaE